MGGHYLDFANGSSASFPADSLGMGLCRRAPAGEFQGGPVCAGGGTTCGPCRMCPPNAMAIANTKPATTALTIVPLTIGRSGLLLFGLGGAHRERVRHLGGADRPD